MFPKTCYHLILTLILVLIPAVPLQIPYGFDTLPAACFLSISNSLISVYYAVINTDNLPKPDPNP